MKNRQMKYADIIIDISHENLDKTYQYLIPKELEDQIVVGSMVEVPFGRGNRIIKGYVISFSPHPKWKVELIKEVHGIVDDALVIEGQLIQLAYWIKETFGATMNDALRAVIPVKKSIKAKTKKNIRLTASPEKSKDYLKFCIQRNYKARIRLLEALIEKKEMDYSFAINSLNISRQTMIDLEKLNIITIDVEKIYRNPLQKESINKEIHKLTKEQQFIVDDFTCDYRQGIRNTYLIHGITGSGKTEVYMEIISKVIEDGKKVIMLIPEIALTYQTVSRFYQYFGNRVSVMNSRLSQGERYDQYLRAKDGTIDIIIGPRSALFAPFRNLGLIIIDEEHESSYKSDNLPKYHAREVAIRRARQTDASVILGSATPSIASYKKAIEGEYKLYSLLSRVGKGTLPKVWIVDLREELKKKNKSIFSIKLKELIKDRLLKKEQIILFLNRRGYAGFVSCRSCGHVMKCPHCDISLTSHNNGKLICHYCGYEEGIPNKCPTCGSKFIAAFGTGTQKVEDFVKREFPEAKVLRMDMDTTKKKNSHQDILSAFAKGEADILVGTQMIVKGHDFPNVTLVGILAADLSLYAGDYLAAEKTFQLLVQASGRAGRGNIPGEVVIQTYNPEHYSIQSAKTGDYFEFYNQEIRYRQLLMYPPAANILCILVASKDEEKGKQGAELITKTGKVWEEKKKPEFESKIIGPAPARLSKANDIYRYIIYVKQIDYQYLVQMKDYLEEYIQLSEYMKSCNVQFDFNPMNSY